MIRLLLCLCIIFCLLFANGCVSEKRIVKIIEKHEANKLRRVNAEQGGRLFRMIDTIQLSVFDVRDVRGTYVEYDSIFRTLIPITPIKNK